MATGPEKGVFSTDLKVKWVSKKLSQHVVKAVEGGKTFFQSLELGYEKFPHNTTGNQY